MMPYTLQVLKGKKMYLQLLLRMGRKSGKWNTEILRQMSTLLKAAVLQPTHNGKILVVSGQGDLACVTRDGKIAWSVNYYQKYSAKIQRFGISESPLVVDNKVIATPGGNMASMVAFNIENGNVVWETPPLNEGTQYTNPLAD